MTQSTECERKWKENLHTAIVAEEINSYSFIMNLNNSARPWPWAFCYFREDELIYFKRDITNLKCFGFLLRHFVLIFVSRCSIVENDAIEVVKVQKIQNQRMKITNVTKLMLDSIANKWVVALISRHSCGLLVRWPMGAFNSIRRFDCGILFRTLSMRFSRFVAFIMSNNICKVKNCVIERTSFNRYSF